MIALHTTEPRPNDPSHPALPAPARCEADVMNIPLRTGDWTSASQSPSLGRHAAGEPSAFEMKFLLDEIQAREVEACLQPCLSLDPYADPALENAYRITTLYYDTPQFDVFRGVGRHRYRKFRLRRYGEDSRLFLERKTKRGERVRKRRSMIDGVDVSRLVPSYDENLELPLENDWEGTWFSHQLKRQRLDPVCTVVYDRVAYFGTTECGPVRLTFDRGVRGGLTRSWSTLKFNRGLAFLQNRVICEFKFRGTLPQLFKSVIEELRLVPCGVSKFRHCLRAYGVTGNGGHSDE